MLNFMLDASATDTFPFFTPERMLSALGVLGRGVVTVFAVLCIVWGALVVIRIFLHDIPARRAAAKEQAPAAPAAPVAPPAPVVASTDDTLLVAILTAAVAAFRAEEGDSDTGFRVVSFNRTKK